jgi:hypothetical protein
MGNSDYSQLNNILGLFSQVEYRASNSKTKMKGGEQHGTKRGMRVEKAVWELS